MSDTLFDLAVICPECHSDKICSYRQKVIENGALFDKIVSYCCRDCLTWFAPGEGVTE